MSKDVINVECIDDYRLCLTFEGGDRREVDIAALVPFDGIFAPLKDPAYFRQVRVEPDVGTIVWPNGANICPDVLCESSESPVSGSSGVVWCRMGPRGGLPCLPLDRCSCL